MKKDRQSTERIIGEVRGASGARRNLIGKTDSSKRGKKVNRENDSESKDKQN